MSSRPAQVEPGLLKATRALTKAEEQKVRKGEAQLKPGQANPWRIVKHRLGG